MSQVLFMLLIGFGVNQDVIDEYDNKLIKVWLEYLVH